MAKRIKRTNRNLIDWVAIETEYRAGQLSINEIARKSDISAPAILKRAKKLGWMRDLKERVKERLRAGALKRYQEVNDQVNTETHLSEEDIINKVTARTLGVVELHKATAAEIQEQIQRLINRSKQYHAIRLEDLKDLSTVTRNLSASFETMVKVERKAYGLEDDDEGKGNQNVLIIEGLDSHDGPGTKPVEDAVNG